MVSHMRLLTRLAALVTKGENAMKRKTLGRRTFATFATAITLSEASAVTLTLIT